MNVLLVDDDRFVIAALMKGIHWKELGFDQVFTAYNTPKPAPLSSKIPLISF